MYETLATVVGTVVTEPVKRDLASGEQMLSFRLASTARRLDRESGEWVDNGMLFLTVSCWRRLVAGVDASIHRGDPVIVQGQLRSNEYRTRDGAERRDLEMRAHTVGPDLTRCTAQVVRRRTGYAMVTGNNPADPDAGTAGDGVAGEQDHPLGEESASGDRPVNADV
ncbi:MULTISPECIES: single-stranded DNA-binding protein [Nocardia]|uniref:single-stranded DNA-binding protein n=1 Tax=Nocardia TaxID=1817 RepID=UPI0018932FC3|nr:MULTISPECIES: single-stranded DNA-binding protein [Nocardia]MBF6351387.1 single-stranded DNA-binding protein [Nocardia flavorosea]